jgi:hypothetical protein
MLIIDKSKLYFLKNAQISQYIMKKLQKLRVLLVLFIVFGFVVNCSKKIDPITGEEKIPELDTNKKAREFAEKGGGLFGDINKKNSGTTYEFASSNILWRATLKSLDFLTIINADYSGGIIIYDWYSENLNSKEQIKVSIKFLSNELRSDSVQVNVHKKTCENINNCIVSKLENKFSSEIKEKILLTAKSMKIEESKKDPKN